MTGNEAPDGWRVVRLGDVATIVMGQAPPGATVLDWNGDTPGEGLPFIQGNAEFAGTHPSPIKWCRQPAKVAEAGDTLITVRAPVGEMNVADRRLAIGRGVAAIRFTGVDARFGWHQLSIARDGFSRIAQGSTFTAINSVDLMNLGLLAPPPTEQAGIAEVLDAIDAAIEKTEAVIDATERLSSALLQQLLTRGVPGWHTEWKDVPGIGAIPACWEVVQLGDCISKPEYGTNASLHDEPNGIAVLRMGNLQSGAVELDALKWGDLGPEELTQLTLRSGDILFNRTNSIDLVGKVGIVRDLSFPTSFASYLLRLRALPNKAVPEWLTCVLNQPAVQARLRRMATKGASQANINPTSLCSLKIGRPAVEEQEAMVALLEGIRSRVLAERRTVEVLTATKSSLSEALLSGALRVPPLAGGQE